MPTRILGFSSGTRVKTKIDGGWGGGGEGREGIKNILVLMVLGRNLRCAETFFGGER